MKITWINETEVNSLKKGTIKPEGKRLVKLIGFGKDETGKIYGHWQFILKRTLKPSGKSTSFYDLV